jgi:hypothetical protein
MIVYSALSLLSTINLLEHEDASMPDCNCTCLQCEAGNHEKCDFGLCIQLQGAMKPTQVLFQCMSAGPFLEESALSNPQSRIDHLQRREEYGE